MYGSWSENVVLWRIFLKLIRHIKRFDDVNLLSLSAKSATNKFIQVDVQNHPFGWLSFENRFFFKLKNKDDSKCKIYSTVLIIRFLGTYFSIDVCQYINVRIYYFIFHHFNVFLILYEFIRRLLHILQMSSF